MIALLYKLIIGSLHRHKWVTEVHGNIVSHDDKEGKAVPTGAFKDCRCKTCGTWKRFSLRS